MRHWEGLELILFIIGWLANIFATFRQSLSEGLQYFGKGYHIGKSIRTIRNIWRVSKSAVFEHMLWITIISNFFLNDSNYIKLKLECHYNTVEYLQTWFSMPTQWMNQNKNQIVSIHNRFLITHPDEWDIECLLREFGGKNCVLLSSAK